MSVYTTSVSEQYSTDFTTASQYKRERVHKVISGHTNLITGCTGSSKHLTVDDFTEGTETTGQRFPKVSAQEQESEIRVLTPRAFRHHTHQARGDARKLYPLIVGDGKWVQNHMRFYNRSCDKVFRQGIRDTNYTGPDGTTTADIDAANILDVDFVITGAAADSNLTIEKLVEINHLARQNELIGEDSAYPDAQVHCAVSSAMLRGLEVSIYNNSEKDYPSFEQLRDNKTNQFKNIVFHRTEDVPTTTTANVDEALFWVPELTALGVWESFYYRVWENSETDFSHDQYSSFEMKACRLQDNAVFVAECDVTL